MKLRVLVSVLFVALVAGCAGPNQGQIEASGQIEAKQVDIAAELSGRVVEVSVNEGDSVKAGDALLRLDDSLLLEQRKAAAARLDSAKAASQSAQNALHIAEAQYQVTLEDALAQDQQARLHDWFSKDQKQFDQPNWYFTRLEQIQAMEEQVDEARKSQQNAEAKLTDMTPSLDKADFLAAEKRLLNARLAYLVTKDVDKKAENSTKVDAPAGLYNSTHCGTNQGYRLANAQLTNEVYGCTGDQQLSEVSQQQYDAAQVELKAAQQAYNALLSTQAAGDVLKARAEVSVAQERYYSALDRLRSLQTGDQSPSVMAAQGAVEQAQATYDQSQKSIGEAQADLDLIDMQLKKLTVRAPMDGVVLVRSIESGEVIQAGVPAMTIGQLDILKLTVYIPEDQYGQIRLGQKAKLSVDSLPNRSFTGTVIDIADQAEFTPQNVQTKEGRQTTVYAIELTLDNKDGKLKPGMPADVTFASQDIAK